MKNEFYLEQKINSLNINIKNFCLNVTISKKFVTSLELLPNRKSIKLLNQ